MIPIKSGFKSQTVAKNESHLLIILLALKKDTLSELHSESILSRCVVSFYLDDFASLPVAYHNKPVVASGQSLPFETRPTVQLL